jgi:RNA 3'-terminal phosphate cyclase (ATP)
MLEIDGARYSGSGSIVRQAVAYAALTRQPVRIINARSRRPKPGLRPQHVRVVEAIGELVGAATEDVRVESQRIVFRPGTLRTGEGAQVWDVGSAGSTTLLALATIPVLAFGRGPREVELRGGLCQDFAPSVFALQHAVVPLLKKMGLDVAVEMGRPGYVPRGEGILFLSVSPVRGPLRPIDLEQRGGLQRIWGIALSSHLEERKVSHRMAEAARQAFAAAGQSADFELRYDTSALQPGAALACFADLQGGVRLGADRAGARGRPAEAIGSHVARQLLADLGTGATVDRHLADQLILFASLAEGESRFRIPSLTDHIQAGAWLAREFLGAEVRVEDQEMRIRGAGFHASP